MLKKDQCWRCDAICSAPAAKLHCRKCKVAYYCSDGCKGRDEFRHQVDCKTAAMTRKCSGCGKEKTGLSQCGNCLQAWYCDQTCLKKSWPTHKVSCQQVTKKTRELSNRLTDLFVFKETANVQGMGTVYYWGNIPATDLINLPLNEGCDYSKPLSILACGAGDPRNVVLSLSELPEAYQEEVTFVLNDICACTLARTVLILYLLIKGRKQGAASVTQIWYSLRLSEEDFQLVHRTLQELVKASSLEELTNGAMKMHAGQFQKITEVWRTWLQLSSRGGDWITEARRRQFDDAKDGMDLYLKEISKEHKKSASDWLANGILLPKESRKVLPRENFTLTGSDFSLNNNRGDFTYLLQSSLLPFTGWDYKRVREWGHSPSILKMYSEYVSHVLQQCALKLATGQVKFYFLLCNCVEFAPFLPVDLKYDRVTTSNLADFIPFTSLLETLKPLLNPNNPSSVITTEFQNWVMATDLREEAMQRAHDMPRGDSFRRRVLEDTGDPAIANSRAYQAFVEYHDHSAEFIHFLRASLLASDNPSDKNLRRKWKSVAEHNGLIARDFLRCQNRIFPAKWMLNCRRVTILNGFERAVEWIVKQK